MTDHHHHDGHHHGHHHHHHGPGHAHPPATARPSILRMSALQRLGFAAALIALLWACAFWAMR
jgi:cobalt-zinc-cadmium efflux system protein